MASTQQKRDWEGLYREYLKSGLSLKEYSQKSGISHSWLARKFKSMEKAGLQPEGKLVVEEIPAENIPDGFIPVTVKEESAEADIQCPETIRIIIGKAVMELPGVTDEAQLIRILKAVSAAC